MKRPRKEDVPVTEMSGPVDCEAEETISDEKGKSSEVDSMETEVIEEEEERKDSEEQSDSAKTNLEATQCDDSNKNSQADDRASSKEVIQTLY